MFSGPGRPRLSSQRRRLESVWFQGMSDYHVSTYHLLIIEEKAKHKEKKLLGALYCDKVAQTSLGWLHQLQQF